MAPFGGNTSPGEIKPPQNVKWLLLNSLSSSDYKRVLNGNRLIARLVEYFENLGGIPYYWGDVNDASKPLNFKFEGLFSEADMNNCPVEIDWRDRTLYTTTDLKMFYTDAEDKKIPLTPQVTSFVSRIYFTNYNRSTKKESRKWANSDKTKFIFKTTLEHFTGKTIGQVVDATTEAIGPSQFPTTGTRGYPKTTTSVTMSAASVGESQTSFCNNKCFPQCGNDSFCFQQCFTECAF